MPWPIPLLKPATCPACSKHSSNRQDRAQSLHQVVSQMTLLSALHAAKGVQTGSGDGEGHADLEPLGEDLPNDILHKFPHLAGCTAIRVPSAVIQQVSKGNAAFLRGLCGLTVRAACLRWGHDCQPSSNIVSAVLTRSDPQSLHVTGQLGCSQGQDCCAVAALRSVHCSLHKV